MDEAPGRGPGFFDARYAAGQTPWDYGGVPSALKRFLDEHPGPGRALVPGCGFAYEIEAFVSARWEAIGIDFSSVAVARARQSRRFAGKIARYAWGNDYHKLMLENMAPIDALLREQGGCQKCYVDTGPVLERDFAATSGIGWYGKSTMCLNERLGTWFFIGVILTTLDLEADQPVVNRCGSCTRCIDICPTHAIIEPYQLDARRCISYLTIENKGSIPVEFRGAIHDRIYGCDECLEVCPWNRFAKETKERRFYLSDKLKTLSLRELATLSEDEFRALFHESSINRIKRPRFVRNVCVALGNVGTPADLPTLKALSHDPDPLISEHALWAVQRIEDRHAVESLVDTRKLEAY
jgi:epoxyqueuosine reductase